MLEAHEASKSFGYLRAVEGLSFFVRQGEIFGLLGPNGAGGSRKRTRPAWASPRGRGLYRKAKARRAMDSWLERFGILEWKSRRIDELSKGMV